MKLYQYFSIMNENQVLNQNNVYDMYPLYAITTSKKDAKVFEKTRNMNKFVKKIDNNFGKDEILKYVKKYRKNLLSWETLTSGIGKPKTSVLITSAECDMLDSEDVFSLTSYITSDLVSPDIFKNKIIKLLISIDYVGVYNMGSKHISHKVPEIQLYDEGITTNELLLFLSLFDDMLNPIEFINYAKKEDD